VNQKAEVGGSAIVPKTERIGDANEGARKTWVRRVPPPPNKKAATAWIIFFLLVGFAAAVYWLHWNRGWEELESGLKTQQATSPANIHVPVPAEVMERLLVHRVPPTYPAAARKENLQGIIAVDIVVDRDGSVVSMRALNGPDVLARAATDALRWWKFEPYRVNGEPAVVETTVAVEFKR
jgi:TonB family protein